MHVLVVDDEFIERSALERTLTNLFPEISIGVAGDGKEAVESALQSPPDVLLIDIEMPEMNGIDAARSIKTAYPDTVVLFLTAYVKLCRRRILF